MAYLLLAIIIDYYRRLGVFGGVAARRMMWRCIFGFEVWHPRCVSQNHKIKSRCLIVKNTTVFLYYIYKKYMYSGRWCFADQLYVSALYTGHHQSGIINLIGNYTNVHG